MEALVYEDRQKSNYALCVGSIYVHATMYWMWVMALVVGVARDFTSSTFGIGRFANEMKRDRFQLDVNADLRLSNDFRFDMTEGFAAMS